jgi:hypothetical protein
MELLERQDPGLDGTALLGALERALRERQA